MSNGIIKCLYLLLMSTNQIWKVWAYKCPIQWLNVYIYYSCLQNQIWKVRGLSIMFACVGSGDPVRVLRLYTMNTLDTLWSIYCWDICTTCHYWTYVLLLKPYALRTPTMMCVLWLEACWQMRSTLYCVVSFIAACVDASRMIFWDHSVLRWPGKALILVAKLLNLIVADTQVF